MASLEKQGCPSILISFDLPDLLMIAADGFMSNGIPACRQVAVTSDTAVGDLSPWIEDMAEALTTPLTAEEQQAGTWTPPVPPRIAMTGTYTEIMNYFTGDLMATPSGGPWAWMTVGLPIVPPTEELVARMLEGTSHSPDEELTWGGWGNPTRIATVEKVAINAVMAGARPEYMPAILAIAATRGCVGYPGDSSFGNMYVISGPYAKEIGMNMGYCFLESGNPANMSLEHSCQLMGVNLGGCLHGLTNLERTGSLHWGTTFAENPDTPWETLNVNKGYDADESVLLAFGGKVELNPFQNMEPLNCESLEHNQPGTPDHVIAALRCATNQKSAIILMTPDTAHYWANKYDFATTMREFQEWVFYNVTWDCDLWYHNYWFVTHKRRPRYEGYGPGLDHLGTDYLDLPPGTMIPMIDSPDKVTIIVAGGSGDAWTWGFGSPRVSSIDAWR